MADTSYKGQSTRPHWGGADSTIDQHLEIYTHETDTQFQAESVFVGVTPRRTISGSNVIRIDRMGTSKVKGRRSGEALENSPIRTDKLLITVDTVLYIRNPIDYQDQWTGPDYISDMARNNGTEFAIAYDKAHMIQLIKSRDWTAPEHLKPAFNDGIEVEVTLKDNATTEAEHEANAVLLNFAHLEGVNELIRRRAPIHNLVTFVNTKVYSTLLQHPKLMNVNYGPTNNDGFKNRRVTVMNGLPIVEFQEFPTEEDKTNHPLGAAYNCTDEDIKVQMVTFDRSLSLLTIEAQGYTTRFWDDKKEFTNVLDCYTMYNVGVRRPDVIVSTSITWS